MPAEVLKHMKSVQASHRSGLLLTLAASFVWGTTFVVSQIGFQYANPYNLAFLRFATASAGIVAFALPFDKKVGLKRQLLRNSIWFLGGVYALGFLLQYVGQSLTTASEASLLSNLAPILVPIIAFFILKDLITNAQKVGIVLGFFGLFLIARPRLNLGLFNVLGDLLLFGTSVCYAVFIVLSKRLNTESVPSSLAIIVVVTVFLAPAAIWPGNLTLQNLKIELIGWASILYLGYPCTIIALSLYLKGLSSVSASESAILLLLQVLTALFLAAILLGEFLMSAQVIGAFAIVLALMLGTRVNK